jgi:NAD(P)-dependent dehydrogenase (short-subunit alcohol dehydrogenase family)
VVSEPRAAIVTGAGTGLGRAIARVLGEGGVECALAGRRRDALEETAASPGLGDGALVVQADVTLREDRERLVRETLERFGRIDILVNNAGVSGQSPLYDYPEEEWRRIMATNVDACFFLSVLVLPGMRDRGYGRIVNITSVYAWLGLNPSLYPGFFLDDPEGGPVRQPAYHASKGALVTMTKELAGTVARFGITVNAVSPGAFMTEQSEAIVGEGVVEAINERVPIGRFGDPRELAYAVRWVASEEASYMTGAELRVDGGWTTW